jgi:hypothetical protein
MQTGVRKIEWLISRTVNAINSTDTGNLRSGFVRRVILPTSMPRKVSRNLSSRTKQLY